MVHLADILESDNYISKMSDNMTNLPIGKAIDGSVLIKSFESMPHLLVAGATGMGKSVTVNGFILSLIYQNNPQELRFIMIDPKQVEMELYSGIPHLLAPIVTDSEKALKALKRCVDEMEMRYTILKNHRVKNIYEYNELVPKEEKMSRIVIVIDELADLMLSSKLRKDVEIAITRIAQKARAVGMHLLIATQRPQVNVITGIIKANIPARISLGVISWIDSRTILDTKGAEDLMSK
jgi:DNA segregation ATPase FtsK/SpoIIIE, S-DNA-T family